MSMGPPRCPRHGGLPGLQSSAPCTCYGDDRIDGYCAFCGVPGHVAKECTALDGVITRSQVPDWQHHAAEYAEVIQSYLESLTLAVLLLEEIAMVQALAAHPWALHWLAGHPEWAAYRSSLGASPSA